MAAANVVAWPAAQPGCSTREGRNFQFAQHLVLFDLPRDPELLEQRIGRLDRMDDDRSTVAQRGEQLVARAVPARALPGGQHDAHCCPTSW